VVNVASAAGLRGHRDMGPDGAAKHGLVGLTRALGLEVARRGVTVNAVCPGWTDTETLAGAVAALGQRTGQGEEEALGTLLSGVPTGRAASPEAVAALVCFVASDEAGDITGAALPVDGGMSAG
jgi:NAD(P)-dependent dehydrogenase (short-subunit alcohol dehydrogenase family)